MPDLELPKTPVHVLSGFLGTGKTTAIRALLERRGKKERIALVINEFGDLGIDGALLSDCSSCLLMEVPGGCVCCTALADLEASLEEIFLLVAPDRIVIEPTGLAKASDIVDVLRRPVWEGRIDLRPVITFVDPAQDLKALYGAGGLFRDQIDAGDYLVLNRCDLATPEQIQTAEAFVRSLFPPKLGIHRTTFGALPDAVLRSRKTEPRSTSALPAIHSSASKTPRKGTRRNIVDGFEGRGWSYPSHRVFDSERVDSFLETLIAGRGILGSVARAKGILHTTSGWKVFEVAGGTLHVAPSSYRRDNRFDVILKDAGKDCLTTLESHLASCLLDDKEPLLSVETETGQISTFSHQRLAELASADSKADDVPLTAVLDACGAPEDLPWLWLISEQGFFGSGARREILARGRIVFAEGGLPLTAENGGPFRFEVTDEEAQGVEDEVDRCRSVPALCSLRLAVLPGTRTVPPLPLPTGFAEEEGLPPQTGRPGSP